METQMAAASLDPVVCCFCGGGALKETHRGLFHPFKKDHGPFSFHRCAGCGSGLTLQPPTRDQLTRLYASFQDGWAGPLREMMQGDPQQMLYSLQVKRLLRHARKARLNIRTWLDVGAGGGPLSRILAEELPDATGVAVDLHDRPAALALHEQIAWKQVDINDDGFSEAVGGTAQLVVSSAVWEHVLHPDRFIRNLLRLLEPGGLLYLMTPDYGSAARRLLGRRWPYFEPGEHLNMPTLAGARSCLSRQWRELHGERRAPLIVCRRLNLPYTLRYAFRRFGMNALGGLLPPGLSLPLPSGALEAVLLAPAELPR
jgi:SAM-dependent methyltransferase